MSAEVIVVVALGTIGILAAIPMLHLLGVALGGQPLTGSWSSLNVASAVGLVVGGTGALIIHVPQIFLLQSAALGALFAAIATVPVRSVGGGRFSVVLSALLASAIVYVPACTLVFFRWFDPFATHLGVIDFGIALPALVGGCAVAIGAILPGLRGGGTDVRPAPTGRAAVLAFLGLWAATIAWLLGMELAIDAISPLILINLLIMPVVSAATGAIVERARQMATTAQGLAGAGLAGVAAAVPAAANLEPVLALATAVIAGVICSLLLPRGGYVVGSRLVLRTLLVGAATGIVLLGVFARDVGMFYTGQPELLFGQLLATLMVLVVSLGVGLVLRVVGSVQSARLPA